MIRNPLLIGRWYGRGMSRPYRPLPMFFFVPIRQPDQHEHDGQRFEKPDGGQPQEHFQGYSWRVFCQTEHLFYQRLTFLDRTSILIRHRILRHNTRIFILQHLSHGLISVRSLAHLYQEDNQDDPKNFNDGRTMEPECDKILFVHKSMIRQQLEIPKTVF